MNYWEVWECTQVVELYIDWNANEGGKLKPAPCR